MRRSLVVLMVFALFATPLYADVIPSRRAAAATDSTRVPDVKAVPMTQADQAFFAAHPERVQVVGAQQDAFSGQSDNLWFETICGAGFLGLGAGIIWYMLTNNE